MIDIKEGDVLEWDAVNGPKRGYVVKDSEQMFVYFPDGHSFFLRDLEKVPSLRIVGKVKVK